MRSRAWAVLVIIVGLQLASVTPALANVPVLVSDTDHIQLAIGEDKKLTASVTLANGSDTPLPVTAEPVPTAGTCGVKPVGSPVAAQHQSKLEFEFVGCPSDKPVNFILTAGSTKFTLTADAPKTPKPNWLVLIAFPIAGVVGGLLTLIAYSGSNTSGQPRSMKMILPGLAPSWKFTDSWATNATVVTALFSGLFGAKEVTTALLGEDASAVLALAIVAAALAVGLVGLAPMVVQATRKFAEASNGTESEGGEAWEIKAGYYVTPGGLCLAAAFTLAGTGGQLAVLLIALHGTDVPDSLLLVAGATGIALIGWYAWQSTKQNLRVGAKPPAKATDPVEVASTVSSDGSLPTIASPVTMNTRFFAPRSTSPSLTAAVF